MNSIVNPIKTILTETLSHRLRIINDVIENWCDKSIIHLKNVFLIEKLFPVVNYMKSSTIDHQCR